jgi:hypothetical protein
MCIKALDKCSGLFSFISIVLLIASIYIDITNIYLQYIGTYIIFVS